MGFIKSVFTCLNKFVVFRGTASHAEFRSFLVFFLGMLTLGFFLDYTDSPLKVLSHRYTGLSWFFFLFVFFLSPMVAVTARRLHALYSSFFVAPVYLFFGFMLDAFLGSFLQALLLRVGLWMRLFSPDVLYPAAEFFSFAIWYMFSHILIFLPIILLCGKSTPLVVQYPEEDEETLWEEDQANPVPQEYAQKRQPTVSHAENIVTTASSHASHDTFCTPYSGKVRHSKGGDLKDAL